LSFPKRNIVSLFGIRLQLILSNEGMLRVFGIWNCWQGLKLKEINNWMCRQINYHLRNENLNFGVGNQPRLARNPRKRNLFRNTKVLRVVRILRKSTVQVQLDRSQKCWECSEAWHPLAVENIKSVRSICPTTTFSTHLFPISMLWW